MNREWSAANKDRVSDYARKYSRLRNGFTEDRFALALAIQNRACAICKTPFAHLTTRSCHTDHDHQSNEPRGVLCHHCNTGLGAFKDSPALLAAAANYLVNPTLKEAPMLEPKVEDLKLALVENTAALLSLQAMLAGLTLTATAAAVQGPKSAPAPAAVAGPTTAKAAAPEKTASASTQAAASAAAAAPALTAATPPDPKAAAVSQPTETAAATPASSPAASSPAPSTVTYEDVKTLVLKVSKEKGRDAAAGVLAGFGVAKAPELKPEQYADAVAQLQAVLA